MLKSQWFGADVPFATRAVLVVAAGNLESVAGGVGPVPAGPARGGGTAPGSVAAASP